MARTSFVPNQQNVHQQLASCLTLPRETRLARRLLNDIRLYSADAERAGFSANDGGFLLVPGPVPCASWTVRGCQSAKTARTWFPCSEFT